MQDQSIEPEWTKNIVGLELETRWENEPSASISWLHRSTLYIISSNCQKETDYSLGDRENKMLKNLQRQSCPSMGPFFLTRTANCWPDPLQPADAKKILTLLGQKWASKLERR